MFSIIKHLKTVKKFIKKMFYFDVWMIGIAKCRIENFNFNKSSIIWFKNPSKTTFRADPFGFRINDRTYIIFEEYSQFLKRGRIAIAEIINDKLINKKIILDNKKHLSYPYIFLDGDKIFMVCEYYKLKKLDLYILDKSNLTLKKIRELFNDHEAIDPSIIKFKEKYWLFYSRHEKAEENLYLAYANSLNDDFIQHPKNPIKSCKSSSRNGGTPFFINDEIFRPSQNCQKFYGEKITINKIITLDENNFG